MLSFSDEPTLFLPHLPIRPVGATYWPAEQAPAPGISQELVTASLQDLIEHTSPTAPPERHAALPVPAVASRQIPGATIAAVPPMTLPAPPVPIPALTGSPLRSKFRFGPPPAPARTKAPSADNPALGPPPQEFFRRPEPGPPAGAHFARRLSSPSASAAVPSATSASPFVTRSRALAEEPPAAATPPSSVTTESPSSLPSVSEIVMAKMPRSEEPLDHSTSSSSHPFASSKSSDVDALPTFAAGKPPMQIPTVVKVSLPVALTLLGIGLYFFFAQPSTTSAAAATTGVTLPAGQASGWTTDFAGDVQGASKGRQLLLYRRSLNTADYDFQFAGQIREKSLGWVIHAKDPRNYCAMRIEVLQPGPNPKVSFYKFAVVDGQEGPRTALPLPVRVQDSTVFRVEAMAHNGVVTTKIQDQTVDVWNEDRIKDGAAGFLTERGERSTIQSVKYADQH